MADGDCSADACRSSGISSNSLFFLVLRYDPVWSFRWLWGLLHLAAKSQRDRLYRIRNLDRISARRKAKYAVDPTPAISRAKKRYSEKHEQIVEKITARYHEDPEYRERVKKKTFEWTKANPGSRTRSWRARQNLPAPTRPIPATCENCGRPPGKKPLALDHCHETGIFRGWLCGPCNLAIGALGDSETGLLRALNYLGRSK